MNNVLKTIIKNNKELTNLETLADDFFNQEASTKHLYDRCLKMLETETNYDKALAFINRLAFEI